MQLRSVSGISADVIWEEKYGKVDEKKGECERKKNGKKDERKRENLS